MRRYGFCLVIFSLCLLMLSGCGKLDRKGTVPANTPPTVFFANVPAESTYFSVNPRIHWFGTDVDGFIAAYQYAVMVTDSVVQFGGLDQVKGFLHSIPSDSVSWVNQTSLKNMIGVHVVSEPGGHERDVRTYADMDPDIYTPQYLLLRAVDNRGEVSAVISRLFYRNNHRPEAFIDVDSAFAAKNHYCLEDTNATWKGINISWSGLDTADYPELRYQPDFQFKWELVGPFETAPTALTVDTMAVADSSLDSVVISGEVIHTRWVSDGSYVFRNLENATGFGYGWYQLRVRTRDDAYVSTDTATTLNIRILKPQFRYADQGRKTVLLVEGTRYGGPPGGLVGSATETPDTAFVRGFYRTGLEKLLGDGLYEEFSLWFDQTVDPWGGGKSVPIEDTLARYDLVIVTNVGSVPDLSEDSYRAFREYLNVGGRLWIIGMNNFNFSPGRGLKAMETIRGVSPNTYQVGVEYCGIDRVFIPTWTSLDSMTLEFVQAKPFGYWDHLSVLSADTIVCKRLIQYLPNDAFQQWGVRGIPWVTHVAMSNNMDWAFRIPAQRRILSFVSYYGALSPMHDRPCGVNYIGPTFRTTLFTFPLNLMQNEEEDGYPAYQLMKEVIDWFWEDMP
ncbi:MAG: hypothetical protein JSV10_05410 [Candidatus Zixiibacteriota bacterium]|nr:MAG: hypothetical protein JSV10_05410 [candidate division Zixibacteria bacterium]